jgi:hypothetical protein
MARLRRGKQHKTPASEHTKPATAALEFVSGGAPIPDTVLPKILF